MKRLITSSCASRNLSHLFARCKISSNPLQLNQPPQRVFQSYPVRFFSNSDDDKSKDNANSDPFGVSFDDGEDLGKVGPTSQLPPKYKRDAATGKLTGDVEADLTSGEREMLRMDHLERDRLMLQRIVESWKDDNIDEKTGDPKPVADFARRVRLAKMSLNVLGRSVEAQSAKTVLHDGDEVGRDNESGFTQHLTRSEFETFRKFMREHHQTEITEDDLPVHSDDATSRPRSPLDEEDIYEQGITDETDADPDNPDLSLKWLTSRAKWEVSKRYGAETPFDDLHARDLNVSRIVNRKRAKVLPTEILHHNNLALLRRYISPAGQIKHRVRTRLGARDQRRVARLIKRARKLGLIPHSGQFVVESHGSIYEKDIHEMKPWEKELERRGLVMKPVEGESRA